MNSNSEPSNEYSDEQLDALLRDVDVPVDLKQELLSIADENLAQPTPSSTISLKLARWFALAASLAGIALFASWAFDSGKNREAVPVAAIPNSESANEVNDETDRILQEMEQLRIEFDFALAQLQIERLERSLFEAKLAQRSAVSIDELIATVHAIADQTPVVLGAPRETAIGDMENVIRMWPNTRGAAIARNFIEQTDP